MTKVEKSLVGNWHLIEVKRLNICQICRHLSVLAWRIPSTGEPGGLPSMGSHRFGHDWSDLAAAAAKSLIDRDSCLRNSSCLSPFWKKLRIFIQILLILFSHFKTSSNLAWLYGLAESHYLVVLDLNEAEIWTGTMGMDPTSRTKIWTVKELPMVKQFPNERIKLGWAKFK